MKYSTFLHLPKHDTKNLIKKVRGEKFDINYLEHNTRNLLIYESIKLEKLI